MDNKEIRVFKAQELRVKEDSRTIEGYAAIFNTESEDFGWFIESIAPGAFDDVLSDDVRALFNHNDDLILARTPKTLSISVDEKGLRYKFDAPNTTAGNDLIESVKRGDITQSSFGFTVKSDKWEELKIEKDGYKLRKTKRTILKLERLYDVSPVTFPAYPDTEVALRKFKAIETPEPPAIDIKKQQAHLVRALNLLTKKATQL